MTMRKLFAATAVAACLVASGTAFATGNRNNNHHHGHHHHGHGKNGGGVVIIIGGGGFGGGFFCGGGNGGCSNSPVTVKSCTRELRADTRALSCDVVSLFIDLIRGRPIDDNLQDIAQSAAEVQFDRNVLAGLRR